MKIPGFTADAGLYRAGMATGLLVDTKFQDRWSIEARLRPEVY
jgi:hypothetical protein